MEPIEDCGLTAGVRPGHVLIGQALAQVRKLLGRTAEETMMGKVDEGGRCSC
jgi:hypothetical protein